MAIRSGQDGRASVCLDNVNLDWKIKLTSHTKSIKVA